MKSKRQGRGQSPARPPRFEPRLPSTYNNAIHGRRDDDDDLDPTVRPAVPAPRPRGGEAGRPARGAAIGLPEALRPGTRADGARANVDADPDDDDAQEADAGARLPADEFVGGAYQRRADNPVPGVFVPRWALAVTRSGAERLVLAQLAYWFGVARGGARPRAQIRRDGYYWVAKTYGALGSEVGLAGRQVRHVVAKLRAAGLIVTEHHKFGGMRMTHFRLDAAAIDRAYQRAVAMGSQYNGGADGLF